MMSKDSGIYWEVAMTIVHTVQGSLVRVAVKGDLDLKTAGPLRDALDKLMDRYRDRNLVLDLSEVGFVDSSGLGVILGRYRRLEEQGRAIALTGVRPQVRSVLELAGVESIINITDAIRSWPETAAPN
jgi:stage II sporulation protein AA (anti-sigma F factor antagonist)